MILGHNNRNRHAVRGEAYWQVIIIIPAFLIRMNQFRGSLWKKFYYPKLFMSHCLLQPLCWFWFVKIHNEEKIMMSYLLVFSAFSVFFIILLFGNKIKKLSNYRRCMINRMIPALMIGFIYFAGDAVSMLQMKDAISGIISGVCIFCLSSMGLAFTMNITGFEPLPDFHELCKKRGQSTTDFNDVIFFGCYRCIRIYY